MDEKELKEWLIDFRERMKDIPISMDDITEIVEVVRKERYSIEQEIDKIWNNIGKKIKASGIRQKDIGKIIKEVRQDNKKNL
ncbi:MAG: hypothetical protein EPN82_13790 [Bacteroidetes bacterium]|nr:MAG: hypothetical protein EPN82_13790 [Bacteroidota bacterium]